MNIWIIWAEQKIGELCNLICTTDFMLHQRQLYNVKIFVQVFNLDNQNSQQIKKSVHLFTTPLN